MDDSGNNWRVNYKYVVSHRHNAQRQKVTPYIKVTPHIENAPLEECTPLIPRRGRVSKRVVEHKHVYVTPRVYMPRLIEIVAAGGIIIICAILILERLG